MPTTFGQLAKLLIKEGYHHDHTRGSHYVYYRNNCSVVIPFHKEIHPKTAKSILKAVSEATGKSVQELIQIYKLKI